MSGSERVASAAVARAANAGGDIPDTSLSAAAVEAAEAIAIAPGHIEVSWLDQLEASGLDRLFYGELVGVVARLIGVDSFLVGVGGSLIPLPEPVAGEPSRSVNNRATVTDAWLPTVGTARAATVLSANRPEMLAQKDIHEGFYLAYEDIGELGLVVDGLSRTQMELVAARTSYLNHCVY
ncbi:MAG: hypothetical protein HKN07_08780 [Acidimicrobiia bacterium]|nr:hypothetical protein [Acidimicrobiia bacterium]